jgi:hypothetical protein
LRLHNLRVAAGSEAGLAGIAAHAASPRELSQKIEQLLRDSGVDVRSVADLGALHESGALAISDDVLEEPPEKVGDGGADGECTEANKHVVLGALDALEAMNERVCHVTEREPLGVLARFLLTMAIQRYTPPVCHSLMLSFSLQVPR